MTHSITKQMLYQRLNFLNDLLGYDRETYGPRIDTPTGHKINPNAGNFHLDKCQQGYRVEQMSLTSGETCTTNITARGSKRECYIALNNFIDGAKMAISLGSKIKDAACYIKLR